MKITGLYMPPGASIHIIKSITEFDQVSGLKNQLLKNAEDWRNVTHHYRHATRSCEC